MCGGLRDETTPQQSCTYTHTKTVCEKDAFGNDRNCRTFDVQETGACQNGEQQDLGSVDDLTLGIVGADGHVVATFKVTEDNE